MKSKGAGEACDELAERYLDTVNRLADRAPMPAMTQGFVRAAIRAAASEAYVLGRTSMHDDILAEHRL